MDQCDYWSVDWTGIPWVRFEQCYVIDNKVKIGQREWRVILSIDNGRCSDDDPSQHLRYKISDKEYVCIVKKGNPK
jgi:hypothetical protein